MKSKVRRWMLAAALLGLVGASIAPWNGSRATGAPAQSEVASVQQIKSEALRAFRVGQFDKTSELVGKAASLSTDPAISKMAEWVTSFDSQRKEFSAERQKQYEKAVEDVKLLQSKGKTDYATDAAARAYLLAADKKVFRAEKWVDDLIRSTAARADEYEKQENWIKALRLYSDLGSLEPSEPMWKDRLKSTTRRVRLLAVYTPDSLKKQQEAESKEREEVDALLRPATQPSTKPTKPKVDEENDSFRIDWRDSLKGVQMETLRDALRDAQANYWKDTTFRALALGGLKGVHAIISTRGLEAAFPGLADDAKRTKFLEMIDEWTVKNTDAPANEQHETLQNTLATMKLVNSSTVKLPEEVLVSEFADGAFAELDPFTSMIWPTDLDEFRKSVGGEFSGVGIQIQNDEDGSLKVVSPLEDSPAYKAGIKAGDVITHINGKNAKGITLSQAVKNITGERGTFVKLTVRSPGGESKDYNIRRETIKVASVKGWIHKPGGGWDYFVDAQNKIGYLRMTNFTADTARELDDAMRSLEEQGAKGVILDLRYNPGGLLTAATEVCDKFLTDGVIVSTKGERTEGGNNPVVVRAKRDNDESALPLIVLVNQYSASASEIVSGALKDQKRATIVGERTFGKGSVQMLFPLAARTALLKLTTSHYYLPSDRCIHREENSTEWGVDPDVIVEMTPEQMRAAIDARQELDVLRDANPAEGKQPKLKDEAINVEDAVDRVTGPKTKKNLLETDPQLSAALLLLRLELVGA